jgi:hypothetical protein
VIGREEAFMAEIEVVVRPSIEQQTAEKPQRRYDHRDVEPPPGLRLIERPRHGSRPRRCHASNFVPAGMVPPAGLTAGIARFNAGIARFNERYLPS